MKNNCMNSCFLPGWYRGSLCWWRWRGHTYQQILVHRGLGTHALSSHMPRTQDWHTAAEESSDPGIRWSSQTGENERSKTRWKECYRGFLYLLLHFYFQMMTEPNNYIWKGLMKYSDSELNTCMEICTEKRHWRGWECQDCHWVTGCSSCTSCWPGPPWWQWSPDCSTGF